MTKKFAEFTATVAGAALLSFLLITAMPAFAQSVPAGSRIPKGYEPQPIKLGAFLWEPALSLTTSYDDNFFAKSSHEIGAMNYSMSSALSVNSIWARNALSANVHYEYNNYSGHVSEDDVTGGADAQLVLNLGRDFTVTSAASSGVFSLQRSAINSAQSLKSQQLYQKTSFTNSIDKKFDRISVTATANFEDTENKNNSDTSGHLIYLKDQDHSNTTGSIRIGYDYSPLTRFFIDANRNARSYRNALPVRCREILMAMMSRSGRSLNSPISLMGRCRSVIWSSNTRQSFSSEARGRQSRRMSITI